MRTFHPDFIAGLAAKVIRPYYALEIQAQPAQRVWTGDYATQIFGNTFVAAPMILGFDDSMSTESLQATPFKLTVSGFESGDGSLRKMALTESYQGLISTVWFGLKAADGTTPDRMTMVAYKGFLDRMELLQDPSEGVVLNLEIGSPMTRLNRSEPLYFTDESQNARDPSDRSLAFIKSVALTPIAWGQEGTSSLTESR